MEMKKVKAITEDELEKQLSENQEYKYGFTTDVDSDVIPIGLDEDVVRLISSKNDEPQWLLNFRLKALKMSSYKFVLTSVIMQKTNYSIRIQKINFCVLKCIKV